MSPVEVHLTHVRDGAILSRKAVTAASAGELAISEAEWNTLTGTDAGTVWHGEPGAESGTLFSRTPVDEVRLADILGGTLDPRYTGTSAAENAVCFASGTLLDTPQGSRPVEDLAPGDLVHTVDNGPQPVRWVGYTTLRPGPDLRPIRFTAGALSPQTPSRDLLVSPAHRMVISGWRAEVLFGQEGVLVAARDLVNDNTIRPATDVDVITFHHVLFDQHEIVWSNGAMSESFHPGEVSLDKLAAAARAEILRLFPQLEGSRGTYGTLARMVVSGREARVIAD